MTLKERLRHGERVYGTMVRIQRNPAYCIIAKNAGMDFILFDCEHGNYNMETMHDMFQMAHVLGLHAMLRVPMLDKESISRYLDAGAKGVMVPMTETAEQAQEIVHWSKYPPIGERGYGSGIGASYYRTGLNSMDAMREINDTVLSIAQIETKLAIENCEEIISTEGIDAVIIGPNDLSISLGIPGQLTSDLELDAIRKVAQTCKKYNKGFGIHGPEKLNQIFAEYINLCAFSTDTECLINGMKSMKERMVGWSQS
ncbi:MAG: 2,4-dihydroxyhept-2-ene-1,7-dioic acid aldolase [Lachnospiraceae bacterium]|nr:2,4-dihydroxyhept-2-ene-1,7-dioic acid aldolase [Lachnospiraceae bacterium]